MELEQWVAAVLSGLILAGAAFGLTKLILLHMRHERESKEWLLREWEKRQRPLPWMHKKTTVKKRTKRKGDSDDK